MLVSTSSLFLTFQIELPESEEPETSEEEEPELVEDCEVVREETLLVGDSCPQPNDRTPIWTSSSS